MPRIRAPARAFLRWVLAAHLSALAFAGAEPAATAPATNSARPNLVVILADDFGYECVGANGSASYQTPRIDRLATQGVRFEHAYAQPLCTPSRVQLMTGLYNIRNYTRFGLLNPGETTFANHLRDAGYATCMVGKWQLGGDEKSPAAFGFDDFCLWQFTEDRQSADGRDTRYSGPRLCINGVTRNFPRDAYGPDLVAEHALGFMRRQHEAKKPFLLYFSMLLTHCPFSPTPSSSGWLDDDDAVRSYKGDPKYFADMVAYADKQVGRVLDELDRLGLADDTLVLFTGDNGTDVPIKTRMTDGRVIRGAKGETIDGGTRVPLVARWPGRIPAGRTTSALADFTDLLPTLLDAARVPLPADATLDGHSLLPLLTGASHEGPRQAVYSWFSRNGQEKGARVFARDPRWKLYRDGKFFDVPADPEEKHPLAIDSLSPEARAARDRLQTVIDRYSKLRRRAQ